MCTQLLKPHITSEIKRCALMIPLLIRMTAFFMNQEEKNLNLNSRVHEWVHTRSLHWFFLLRIHNMRKFRHKWRRYKLKLESVNVARIFSYARILGKGGGGPPTPENYFCKVKFIVEYQKMGLGPPTIPGKPNYPFGSLPREIFSESDFYFM